MTHIATAQLYLGTTTFLVLVATHILVTIPPIIPSNLNLDVCPTTSVFITIILVTSIKIYAYGCIFIAIGSTVVRFIATTPSTFKQQQGNILNGWLLSVSKSAIVIVLNDSLIILKTLIIDKPKAAELAKTSLNQPKPAETMISLNQQNSYWTAAHRITFQH